ncbi:MAG TPA: hypothetical protein VGO07_00705 [Candidatus Saccharimonadales bacterium]|jgi:hypothetical protein|nr:hypothetical protein [Candidatus Saccharimonadales bacterium]
MKSKKALIMAGVGTVVGLAAFAGVASAQTPAASDGQQSLVDKISAKFNLNKSDVQAVFDQDKSAHQAEMQQKMDDRLTQAVTDGKITAAQKTAIESKHAEVKAYFESIKDKPAAEQKTLMKAKMDELQQWAKDNGLSDFFMMKGGMHIGGGPGLSGNVNVKADTGVSEDSTN